MKSAMLTFMCGIFGMNFGDNWDKTSPISTRLINCLRIFIMRTIAASIKWPRFSSMRWSVCFCSARRSDSNLPVISNRIFGLFRWEIQRKLFLMHDTAFVLCNTNTYSLYALLISMFDFSHNGPWVWSDRFKSFILIIDSNNDII